MQETSAIVTFLFITWQNNFMSEVIHIGGYSSKKSLFFPILAVTRYSQVLYISTILGPKFPPPRRETEEYPPMLCSCRNVEPFSRSTYNYSYWQWLVSGAPLGVPGAKCPPGFMTYGVMQCAACRHQSSADARKMPRLLGNWDSHPHLLYTSICPAWHFLPSLVSMSAAYLPCTTSLNKNVAMIIKVMRPKSIWIE